MASFGLTERGERKIIYNGFGYVKHKETKRGQRWRCEYFNSCTAYCYSVSDVITGGDVKEEGKHYHDMEIAKLELKRDLNMWLLISRKRL